MKFFVFFEFNTKGTVALEKKSGKSFAINPLINSDCTHHTSNLVCWQITVHCIEYSVWYFEKGIKQSVRLTHILKHKSGLISLNAWILMWCFQSLKPLEIVTALLS